MSVSMPQDDRAHFITAKHAEVSNCDREQIHAPGAIQPHGVLLVVDEANLTIVQASVNCEAVFKIPHALMIGQPLGIILGAARTQVVQQRIAGEALDDGPRHLLRTVLAEVDCNLFAHRSAGSLILEIEVSPPSALSIVSDPYSDLRETISRLHTTKTLQSFLNLAVVQIRLFTGFERVMVYKFLDDGSGHVIAEDVASGLAPYFNLHYPASDIPLPAQRLFALSPLRHLPDACYHPVNLMPERHPVTGEQVDLSRSILRSVSIMYRDYLKNMGGWATMVMPLMKEGRLWGLISCMNHSAPRHVAHETRVAAELLAHMLSTMMAAKEDAESFAARLQTREILDNIIQSLGDGSDLQSGLKQGNLDGRIANYIACNSAAFVIQDQITRFGNAPSAADVKALAAWMATREDLIFATNRMGELYPAATAFAASAAGVLAVRLSKQRPDFIMWFRPEQAQSKLWAGNPAKPVEVEESDGAPKLRPRASFAVWKESLANRSVPWAEFEIKAAADLRLAIVEVILARAEETERLNRDLRDANLELDSFANVAAHDLKEPLRGITHMATFLVRGQANKLDDQGREQVKTIVRLTKRMEDLIGSLQHYAYVGRADPLRHECNLDIALDEALLALQPRIEAAGTMIRRPRKLPKAQGDLVRLREVFTNLISNAIKFNDKAQQWVEVGWTDGEMLAFYVSDNGIGIAEEDRDTIFQIFRRLHGRDEFGGGTGAGLTIARKVIERHGGRMWAESTEGEGCTIRFTLPPVMLS